MRRYGSRRRPRRHSGRRRRSAARSSRTYTLADLLQRQPKTLQKRAEYALLTVYLRNTPELQRARLGSRCYSLLHNARIEAQNLSHFYRTYRLPQHPFFPHFLRVKREYQADRVRIREERRRYILDQMRELPGPVVGFVRYLGYLEDYYNARGSHPLWDQHLFPATKKRVHEYRQYSRAQWMVLFRTHLRRLEQRYRSFPGTVAERLVACFVLGCLPTGFPPQPPASALVKRRYRELSLRHHPDQGGDAATFRELKRACDVLLRC